MQVGLGRAVYGARSDFVAPICGGPVLARSQFIKANEKKTKDYVVVFQNHIELLLLLLFLVERKLH